MENEKPIDRNEHQEIMITETGLAWGVTMLKVKFILKKLIVDNDYKGLEVQDMDSEHRNI